MNRPKGNPDLDFKQIEMLANFSDYSEAVKFVIGSDLNNLWSGHEGG